MLSVVWSDLVCLAGGRSCVEIRVSGRRRTARSLARVWPADCSAGATSAWAPVSSSGRAAPALSDSPCWSPGSPSACWRTPRCSPCSWRWGGRGDCPSSGWWRGELSCPPCSWRGAAGGWRRCDAAQWWGPLQSGCRSGSSWRVLVAEPRGGARGRRSPPCSSFSWPRPGGLVWWWRSALCWTRGGGGAAGWTREVWYVLDWGDNPWDWRHARQSLGLEGWSHSARTAATSCAARPAWGRGRGCRSGTPRPGWRWRSCRQILSQPNLIVKLHWSPDFPQSSNTLYYKEIL